MATRDVGNLRTRLSWEDEGASRSLTGFRQDLKGLRSEMRTITSQGKDYTNSLKGLRQQQDVLNRQFKTQQERVQELRRRYEESAKVKGEDAKQTQNLAAQYNNAVGQMNRTEQQLNRVTDAIEEQVNPWKQLSRNLNDAGTKMQTVGKQMTDFGKNYSMRVTAPIVAGGTAVFKASIDFESAFAGVEKTVDASEQQIASLRTSIRDMAKEIPATTTEIAGVAEAAGQLGIQTENIESFTRTMIDLGEATNLTSDQAATEFARFANIVGMSQEDFDRLGSTIVGLGNNLATTESEISSMAMRLAGAGAQIGLSEAQILAFAGALSSVGIEAEAGGSAFSKVMVELQLAAEQGGDSLESFADVAGVSADEFKKAYEQDATGAIMAFIEGLSTAEDRGLSAIGILDDMGIKEVRLRDTLLRAAGATDVFTEALDIGSTAWEENVALTEEAEKRYETTESQLRIMWNRVKDVAISFGDALAPAIMDAIDAADPLIQRIEDGAQAFADMSEEEQQTILKTIGLVAAIGPASMAFGGITRTAGGALNILSSLSGTIGQKGSGGTGKASLVGGLGTLAATSGPLVGATVAIAGLTAGGIALYNHLQKDVIPEIDLFGDEVSDSTAQALGGFMELNNEATVQLNELSWTGKTVSEEMKESLVGTFDEMGTQIVEGLQEDKNESVAALQELFAEAKGISEEEQNEILNKVNEGYAEREEAVKEGNARIQEILQTASDEKRELTKAEQIEINQIQQDMVDESLEVLTENEKEQKEILDRMKEQASDISKRQAAEVIKNSIEQKDAVIEEAENQYSDVKSTFEIMRDDLGIISAEEADKIIDEAKRQRDETIRNAEEMHQGVLDEAEKQNPELLSQINKTNGEILTEMESLVLDVGREFGKIYSEANDVWEDIKESASSAIGSIESWFSNMNIDLPSVNWSGLGRAALSLTPWYAEGTDYHPGGPAIVGEEGFELAKLGNSWSALGSGMYDLPRGTQVFNHDESKKIIQAMNRLPAYADGISAPGEANRIVNRLNNQESESIRETPIVIENMTVRNDTDIEKIARELHNLQKGARRGLGYR